jgi:hypothetical protein
VAAWLTACLPAGRPAGRLAPYRTEEPVPGSWCRLVCARGPVVYFTTGSEEQKFVNLRANPYVVLTTGTNDWRGGVDVVVEGKAGHVTDEAELTRVAATYRAKWDGAWQYEVRDGRFYHDAGAGIGPSEVFAVTPTRAFAHSKCEPFGATTHRF